MLKPFQIRDLHGSPTQEDAYNSLGCLPRGHHGHNTSRRSGIVQLSASDYDEIALSHPRARLTYADDDDGEIITVSATFCSDLHVLVSNTYILPGRIIS
jgi:hypothetical protein